MQEFQIKTNGSTAILKAIISRLCELGYVIGGRKSMDYEGTVKNYGIPSGENWRILYYKKECGAVHSSYSEKNLPRISLETLFSDDFNKPKPIIPIKVILNKEHTAIVSEDETIHVGCQKIDFSAFDDLAVAVKVMRESIKNKNN
jgi:hypothetical protein